MKTMKAIILVAGYATRMYPLTLNQPKALLSLGGKPVIDYIVEQIERLEVVDHIYVVSNHKFYEPFLTWCSQSKSAVPIDVLDDGTDTNENRRGAIGDILYTLREKNIDDDIFVVAGDNYFTYDLREQYGLFISSGCDTVCAARLADREKLKSFAVAILDENNRVIDLVEKPKEPPSDIAVYATYFDTRETLPLFERYIREGNNTDQPGYFAQWLHKINEVRAYIMNGENHDIGTIEEYEAVNAQLMNTKE
jgi:glucose-1-phosphate thymidylyltransferase